jgi:arabinose-5-phosphate isomerase
MALGSAERSDAAEKEMVTIDCNRALQLARETLAQHRAALWALSKGLDDAFWTCAQLMCDCRGLVWTTGVGTSAAVARRLAHLLTDCGARSMFLSPAEGLHGHTAVMARGDLLLAISRGGESSEVIQMAEIAEEREVPAVALVHDTGSKLTRTCRHVLPVRSPQESELMGMVPTTSTIAFSAMGDALCAVVLQARGYTPEALRATHPGGAVGLGRQS